MTAHTDTEALDKLEDVARANLYMGSATVLALIAELRQERERAGSLTTQRDTARHESVEWEDAFARTEVTLSRAEETIEKAKVHSHDNGSPTYRILAEYGKQKAGLS